MKTTISKVYKCKACGWNKKLNYKVGDTLVRYCPTCSSSDLIMSDSSENHLSDRRSEMKEGKETKYKCNACGKVSLADEDMVSLPIRCPFCGSKDNVEVKESKVDEELFFYKCKDCGKECQKDLNVGDKEVRICPYCGGENLEKVSMDTGESKMAEGMAAYKCYACGLLFTLSDAPSVCPYCGGKPVMRWTTESLNNQIDKLSI